MSISAGLERSPIAAPLSAKFHSFIGKVVSDSSVNIATSACVALLALIPFDYVTSVLAGTVVYLLAENQRMSDCAVRLEEQNRSLKKAQAIAASRLELYPNTGDDFPIAQQANLLSLHHELAEAKNSNQALNKDMAIQKTQLKNCHELIIALRAEKNLLEGQIARNQVEGNPVYKMI